jgi:hypothetical protein
LRTADATGGEDADDRVGDGERRHQRRQRLAEQELLGPDRGREHRLQRVLLSLPGHRIGGDHGRDDRRDGQHVDKGLLVQEHARRRGGQRQQLDARVDAEDHGQDRHRHHDLAVAAVVPELLAEDGPDAPGAQRHLRPASTSSSTSSR